MAYEERKKFDIRLAGLKNKRRPHEGALKDIRDYQVPNRGNFDEDRGKEGQRMDAKIYNGNPALSARTLAAGMNAGITSPSRPWFRLSMNNKSLMERADVRIYLNGVEQRLYQIFNQSNFYSQAAVLYLELGTFGTAPMSIKADFEDVARFDTYTVGEYWIASNKRKVIDVLYRRIWKTAAELLEEFGERNVSQRVRDMARKDNPDDLIKVIHAVEPNDERVPNMIDAKNKAYRSVYYEEESCTNDPAFLKISGFDTFPYVVPRWSVNGSDPYGTDQPGILALGDAKQLQTGAFKKAKGLDRNMNPPLQAPADLKNQRIMNVPGGVTFFSTFNQSQGVKPMYEVRVPLAEIIEDNKEVERRINRSYFVDLFLSILANDRPQDMKAEVAFQIDKERLLMLGPVLEGLNEEFLNPLIDRVFSLAEAANVLPEPPHDLMEQDVKVEYISTLAKAQKAAAISAMERLTGLVGLWAGIDPSVVDKLDLDRAVNEAAGMLDVPAEIIRSEKDVNQVRMAKQQQANAQLAMQAGATAASAAKDLANAPVGTGNMLEQLTGVAPP